MKTLYLIRHAKSSWKNEKLSDFDRPLNSRGLRDAPFMGQRLANYSVSPGIILSSPAMRAIETATTIASEVGYPEDAIQRITSLYLASLNTLLETVNEIDDKHSSAFVFGHNPGMTMFANFLTTYAIDNVPTCGVVCVLFEVDSWKDVAENRGSLSFFDYPRRHLI